MKVAALVQELLAMPQEASIELTRVIALSRSNDAYQVRLDFPIIGLVSNNEGTEVIMVVEYDTGLIKFGTIRRFTDPLEL